MIDAYRSQYLILASLPCSARKANSLMFSKETDVGKVLKGILKTGIFVREGCLDWRMKAVFHSPDPIK